MSINIRIAILAVVLVLSIVIIYILRKDKIPVKYSLLWWVVVVVLLLLSLFPDLFIIFANFLGFETISNMVIGIFIVIILFITMSLTIIVSGQRRKIALLIQEISMLKELINKK